MTATPQYTQEALEGTILVVDDNPVNLGVIVKYLSDYAFRVPVASDGSLVLDRAKRVRPDLILLDVMMRNLDGFETCRQLKADPETSDIPIIFMTALTDAESKIKGLEAGAVDYVTKPIHQGEVLARIRTHLYLQSLRRDLQEQAVELAAANDEITSLNEQLKAENLQMKAEMELARRIQTSILPPLDKIKRSDFEIAAIMLPCTEVGGDYYDVLIGQDGSLWFSIGDVSGHGVTPGLIMMMAQTAHATLVTSAPYSPKDVVILVNKMLYHNLHDRLHTDHFMSFTTLKYLGHGDFEYAGAHNSPIIYRRQSGTFDLLQSKGVWLNFVPDIAYATPNNTFRMEIGDILVLYTDGLTEAHAPNQELLDLPRFQDIIQAHADKDAEALCDGILQDTLAWCGNVRTDDMTLVAARRVR